MIERVAFAPYARAETVRLTIDDGGGGDGVVLTAAQREQLNGAFKAAVVVKPAVIPDGMGLPAAIEAACFVPHHFFDFLSAGGETVGRLSVCFCCDGVAFAPVPGTTVPGASIEEDIDAIETLVRDMGLPVDVGCEAG